MSDEKTTTGTPQPLSLAQQIADDRAPTVQELAQQPKTKSLLRDFAAQAGLNVRDFWPALKTVAGCGGAKDEHFLILLMQAQRYDLDPLRSPPMLQILDVGKGPEVYARVDTYYEFILRAKASGRLEWTEFVEDWFPDPRHPPEKKVTRRGGRLTGKFKDREKLAITTVWFDEWQGGKKWSTMGSQMLKHRAHKEWAREHLGYYLRDTDDAARIGEDVKTTDADVRDAAPIAPAVPIRALGGDVPAAKFAPAPAPLGEPMPFEQDTMTHETEGKPEAAQRVGADNPISPASGGEPVAATVRSAASPPSSEPWTPSPEEEAEIRAEERKKQSELFGNR